MRWTIQISALTAVMALALGSASLALAAGSIAGQVVNGTSQQPAAQQKVQLLQPRGGMQQVAETTTDAQGRFAFSDVDSGAFYLLQAVHDGVNYHATTQFDSTGTSRVNLTIYDSSRTAPPLRIQSMRIQVRAEGNKAHVEDMFGVVNSSDPPRSYVNTDGTFLLQLASGAGDPTAAVAGLMGAVLPQALREGKSPGAFSVNCALKPGMNVILVAYEMDYSRGQLALGDKVPYQIDRAELLVSPPSLAVDSDRFKPSGMDASSGSQRYAATDLAAGAVLEARLSGEAPAGAPAGSGAAEGQVTPVPNSMNRLGIPLLFCFLLILTWALGVRVTKERAAFREMKGEAPARKQLEAAVESLFNSLADLDELFAAGKIAESKYWKERLELRARLVSALKKAPPVVLESYALRHTPH